MPLSVSWEWEAYWRPLGSLLGASGGPHWRPLGRLLGQFLGQVLELQVRAPLLGPSCGRFGGRFGSSWTLLRQKTSMPTSHEIVTFPNGAGSNRFFPEWVAGLFFLAVDLHFGGGIQLQCQLFWRWRSSGTSGAQPGRVERGRVECGRVERADESIADEKKRTSR